MHTLMSRTGITGTVEWWAHAETLKEHRVCRKGQQQCQPVADEASYC